MHLCYTALSQFPDCLWRWWWCCYLCTGLRHDCYTNCNHQGVNWISQLCDEVLCAQALTDLEGVAVIPPETDAQVLKPAPSAGKGRGKARKGAKPLQSTLNSSAHSLLLVFDMSALSGQRQWHACLSFSALLFWTLF